ncbi:calmodulin-like [Littorina saxatilis]|uniref:EF-hand domain-containing protein n=1 Tax=Littorina saxatilis TaxID=31220 RepID=A0AAN9BQW4_9CAEN
MAAKGKGKAGPDTDVYKQLFKEADKNGDGTLSITELRDLFKRGGSNMSDAQIADTFVFFDGAKGDKAITFEEFCAGLDQILNFVKQLEQMFKELDSSGDGFLDRNELKTLLQKTGKKFTEKEVDAILKEADVNGDNKISFKEFVDACT